MKKAKWVQAVVVVAIIVFVVISVSRDDISGGENLSATDWGGYLTGYEGPKPYFYGVSYQGEHYTAWNYGDASYHRFDSYFKFDSDGYSDGKLNIMGEETSIFVPEKAVSNDRSWLPWGWSNDLQYVNNPLSTYEWQIGDKAFYMEEWLMRYYVTFSAEWDGINENPLSLGVLGGTNVYQDVEVWIRIDLEPIQYFSGMEKCYFAIAKVDLAHDVELRMKEGGSDSYSDSGWRNGLSVHPESEASVVMIFYAPWGGEQAQKESYDYSGVELTPDLFTDEVYLHVDLNNFGATGWYELIWERIKADSVTWAFDVKVFVIGEWKVQDIDEDPDLYGRFNRSSSGLGDLWKAFNDLLTSPFGISALIIYLVIGIILIMVFVPGASAMLMGGGKKGGGLQTIIILIVLAILAIIILPRLFGG